MNRLSLFFRLARRIFTKAPQYPDAREIERLVMGLHDIEGVHNVRLGRVVNGSTQTTFHLVTRKRRPRKVIARARQELAKHGIDATTVEWCVAKCPSS